MVLIAVCIGLIVYGSRDKARLSIVMGSAVGLVLGVSFLAGALSVITMYTDIYTEHPQRKVIFKDSSIFKLDSELDQALNDLFDAVGLEKYKAESLEAKIEKYEELLQKVKER
jgi:low affinity Fe/Cu permease